MYTVSFEEIKYTCYFIGIALVLAAIAAYFIVTRSESHFEVFVLTGNYLVAYWFIVPELEIPYSFTYFYDQLPALALFPVTHIAFFIQEKRRKAVEIDV